MRETGRYEKLGSVSYFIPHPLPPDNPSLEMTAKMSALLGEAMFHVGKLNEMAVRIPDAHRFIKAYVTKEALLSSAIEQIQTTLLEMFTQPLLESKPNKNTQLVLNYTNALEAALSLIKESNLPVSSRVILEAHKVLMSLGEGDKADPGNYRKQAVRVGNLIPTPAQYIPELIADLERFINTDSTLPPLIQAGLAHVQFETIHPFLDGNGRIGRLLIVLMLVSSGMLTEPIIYPSYIFKKHNAEYCHLLDRVRITGDFESWIVFYLEAIKQSSIDAYRRATDIEALQNELNKRVIQAKQSRGSALESRLRALAILLSFPVVTINSLSKHLDISFNTASQIVREFEQLGILAETSAQKRDRLFAFADYLELLDREYE